MNTKVRFGFLLGFVVVSLGFSMRPKPLTQQQILDLVNRDRSAHGLSSLELNPTLTLAAQAKARDMLANNYFAHVSPNGATPWSWFKLSGYSYVYAGENLAEGYTDAKELENSWMASPTHRANILSPNYRELGLAVVSFNDTNLVVQLFGSRDNKLTLNSK